MTPLIPGGKFTNALILRCHPRGRDLQNTELELRFETRLEDVKVRSRSEQKSFKERHKATKRALLERSTREGKEIPDRVATDPLSDWEFR